MTVRFKVRFKFWCGGKVHVRVRVRFGSRFSVWVRVRVRVRFMVILRSALCLGSVL